MTMKRCWVAMAAFCLTAVLLYSGNFAYCSPPEALDAKDVIIQAYQNYANLNSYHMTLDTKTSLVAQGNKINVVVKGECDVNVKPMKMKNVITLYTETPSIKSEKNVEQYIEQDGQLFIAYSKVNNQWIKQQIPGYDPLNAYEGYFKAIKSVIPLGTAKGYSDYEVTVDGKYLKESMERTMASGAMQPVKLPEEVFKNIGDVKYRITIDNKTTTIAKFEMDLTKLMATIGDNLAESSVVPEGQRLAIKEMFKSMNMVLTVSFSQINAVDNVSIPPEALTTAVQR